MKNQKGIVSASAEAIYHLKEGLKVPPRRFADFLTEAVYGIKDELLSCLKCCSWDEATEEYMNNLKKLNPELPFDPDVPRPLRLHLIGNIEKIVDRPTSAKPERFYVSEKKIEFWNPRETLPDNYWQHITKKVRSLKKDLNSKFPDRNGQIHAKNLVRFKFGIDATSEIAFLLQASVAVVDDGMMMNVKKGNEYDYVCVPAIRVSASIPFTGHTSLPKRIVASLGQFVQNFYKVSEIETGENYRRRILD